MQQNPHPVLLRSASLGLDDLPKTIAILHRYAITDRLVPIETATLDDIAFALASGNACSVTQSEQAALERLYWQAREAGCIGSEPALASAVKRDTA